MPLTSPTHTGVDLEDFRRLGVRPYETRSDVIRRAALRRARLIAQQQLSDPSAQGGVQLSQVATSAYRLLDPRQRDDEHQRIHVGRILPNTLNYAGQTSFLDDSSMTSGEMPFSGDLMSDAELIQALDLDAPRSQEDAEEWVARASATNRHTRTPKSVRASKPRPRWKHPWIWLAVAGLIAGTVLGLATLKHRTEAPSQSANVPALPTSDDVSVEMRPSASSDLSSIDSIDSAAVESSSIVEHAAAAESGDLGSQLSQPIDMEPALFSDIEQEEATVVSDADPFLPDPFSAAPPELAEIMTPELSPVPSALSAEPPALTPESMLEPAGSETDEVVETEIEPLTENRSFKPASVPDENSVRHARRQLVSLIPQLASSISPGDVPALIEQIKVVQSELEPGTADDWVARITAAQLAWLAENALQVRERLQPISESYEVETLQVLAESFELACGSAHLPESQRHLLEQGLPLADDLLVNERIDFAQRVIVATETLAGEIQAEIEMEQLSDLRQAANQMERLAQTTQRILDPSGELADDFADVGIAGRYQCLMLRKWESGLSWLSEVSNTRIAGAARRELALGDSAPEDRVKVANRWLNVASRSSGRPADSMRLHAVEMLRTAKLDLSGLMKLEVERTIEETLESLPAYLRKPALSQPTPTASQPTEAATPAPNPGSVQSRGGLSGRILVDGADVGAQINYELDVALTSSMLQTVAERLNRELEQVVIQMRGEFELAESASVIVALATVEQEVKQEVQFDDTPIEMIDGKAEVTLGKGKHQIQWTVEIDQLERVFLQLRRADSGERVQVVHAEDPSDSQSPTDLTISVVRP